MLLHDRIAPAFRRGLTVNPIPEEAATALQRHTDRLADLLPKLPDITDETQHPRWYVDLILEAASKATDPGDARAFAASYTSKPPYIATTRSGIAAILFETWVAQKGNDLRNHFVETVVDNQSTFLAIFLGKLDRKMVERMQEQLKDLADLNPIVEYGDKNWEQHEWSELTIYEGTPKGKVTLDKPPVPTLPVSMTHSQQNRNAMGVSESHDNLALLRPTTLDEYRSLIDEGGFTNDLFRRLYRPTPNTVPVEQNGVIWRNIEGHWLPDLEHYEDTEASEACGKPHGKKKGKGKKPKLPEPDVMESMCHMTETAILSLYGTWAVYEATTQAGPDTIGRTIIETDEMMYAVDESYHKLAARVKAALATYGPTLREEADVWIEAMLTEFAEEDGTPCAVPDATTGIIEEAIPRLIKTTLPNDLLEDGTDQNGGGRYALKRRRDATVHDRAAARLEALQEGRLDDATLAEIDTVSVLDEAKYIQAAIQTDDLPKALRSKIKSMASLRGAISISKPIRTKMGEHEVIIRWDASEKAAAHEFDRAWNTLVTDWNRKHPDEQLGLGYHSVSAPVTESLQEGSFKRIATALDELGMKEARPGVWQGTVGGVKVQVTLGKKPGAKTLDGTIAREVMLQADGERGTFRTGSWSPAPQTEQGKAAVAKVVAALKESLQESVLTEAKQVIKALSRIGTFTQKQSGFGAGGNPWIVGNTKDGKYHVELQVFDKPSFYGINGGRVSKLFIRDVTGKRPIPVMEYDRGWGIKPKGAVKKLALRILDAFPAKVNKWDVEPDSVLEALQEGKTDAKMVALVKDLGLKPARRTSMMHKGRIALLVKDDYATAKKAVDRAETDFPVEVEDYGGQALVMVVPKHIQEALQAEAYGDPQATFLLPKLTMKEQDDANGPGFTRYRKLIQMGGTVESTADMAAARKGKYYIRMSAPTDAKLAAIVRAAVKLPGIEVYSIGPIKVKDQGDVEAILKDIGESLQEATDWRLRGDVLMGPGGRKLAVTAKHGDLMVSPYTGGESKPLDKAGLPDAVVKAVRAAAKRGQIKESSGGMRLREQAPPPPADGDEDDGEPETTDRMDEPEFYREDLQAYYDSQLLLGFTEAKAKQRTRQKFGIKSLMVTPTGEVRSEGIVDRPPKTKLPPPGIPAGGMGAEPPPEPVPAEEPPAGGGEEPAQEHIDTVSIDEAKLTLQFGVGGGERPALRMTDVRKAQNIADAMEDDGVAWSWTKSDRDTGVLVAHGPSKALKEFRKHILKMNLPSLVVDGPVEEGLDERTAIFNDDVAQKLIRKGGKFAVKTEGDTFKLGPYVKPSKVLTGSGWTMGPPHLWVHENSEYMARIEGPHIRISVKPDALRGAVKESIDLELDDEGEDLYVVIMQDGEEVHRIEVEDGDIDAAIDAAEDWINANLDVAMAEVSPPGFSGTVRAMKDKHPEIDNPYALAWSMYKRGAKPRKKPEKSPKGMKNYVPPEEYARIKEVSRKLGIASDVIEMAEPLLDTIAQHVCVETVSGTVGGFVHSILGLVAAMPLLKRDRKALREGLNERGFQVPGPKLAGKSMKRAALATDLYKVPAVKLEVDAWFKGGQDDDEFEASLLRLTKAIEKAGTKGFKAGSAANVFLQMSKADYAKLKQGKFEFANESLDEGPGTHPGKLAKLKDLYGNAAVKKVVDAWFKETQGYRQSVDGFKEYRAKLRPVLKAAGVKGADLSNDWTADALLHLKKAEFASLQESLDEQAAYSQSAVLHVRFCQTGRVTLVKTETAYMLPTMARMPAAVGERTEFEMYEQDPAFIGWYDFAQDTESEEPDGDLVVVYRDLDDEFDMGWSNRDAPVAMASQDANTIQVRIEDVADLLRQNDDAAKRALHLRAWKRALQVAREAKLSFKPRSISESVDVPRLLKGMNAIPKDGGRWYSIEGNEAKAIDAVMRKNGFDVKVVKHGIDTVHIATKGSVTITYSYEKGVAATEFKVVKESLDEAKEADVLKRKLSMLSTASRGIVRSGIAAINVTDDSPTIKRKLKAAGWTIDENPVQGEFSAEKGSVLISFHPSEDDESWWAEAKASALKEGTRPF